MTDWIEPDGSFIEWDKPCPECNHSVMVYYKKVNQHIGAYCCFCDKWLGWVKQWTDKDWARRVKERALYRCERCGKYLNGKDAHAHHKIPRKFMPQLQFDLDNGICLCTDCHKQIHGYGGTIKESEEIK